MAKKTETKIEKLERDYVIPIREKGRHVPRYKKTPKAVRTIKEFLVRHMKIRDRDLGKIKIDKYLNEFLWGRGIKNPPHKIKVRAIKEGEIVRAELFDVPESLKFKKLREEKTEQKGKEITEKKKVLEEKKETPEEKNKEETAMEKAEEKKEVEEKKASVVEAGKEIEKAAAKQMKHLVGGKHKEPKIKRVALKK